MALISDLILCILCTICYKPNRNKSLLIIKIIIIAVASHTHCHFKPSFGKQDESFVSPERNLTLKELLAYGSSIRFTVRSLLVEVKKNSRLDFLDRKPRPVLAKRLHISNHLALGVSDPYLLKIPP